MQRGGAAEVVVMVSEQQQYWSVVPDALERFVAQVEAGRRMVGAGGLRHDAAGVGKREEEIAGMAGGLRQDAAVTGSVSAAMLFGREVPRGRVPMMVENGVARVRVEGMLLPEGDAWLDLFGVRYTTYPELVAEVERAAADASVKEIVLLVSSGGGTVMGLNAAADAVYVARQGKPVRAEVQGLCGSAAYYIASQAGEIRGTAESLVGSIGTVVVVDDWSAGAEKAGLKRHVISSGAYKGGGTPGAAVSAEHLALQQELVDAFAAQFFGAVERGRGRQFDAASVYTGRVWVMDAAITLGLADGLLGGVHMGAPGGAKAMAQAEEEMVMEVQEMEKAVAAAREEGHAAGVAAERGRVSALATAFEKDPGYALTAAVAGQGVVEAKAAYADVLDARLTATQAELAAAQAAAAAAVVPPAAPAAVGAVTPPVTPGVGAAGAEGAVGGDDPAAKVAAAQALAKAEGITFAAALKKV